MDEGLINGFKSDIVIRVGSRDTTRQGVSNMGCRKKPTRGPSRRKILKYGLYCGLTAGLSPSLWLSGCERKRYKKRPDVFLISVDTLRADHLSCYGYHRNTSPNIDRFADNALLFENCLSHAPITGSSCVSLLSGFLPHETTVFGNSPPPKKVKMLAEILKRQRYKTIAVVSNYVLRKGIGWEQGFKIYDDKMEDRELVRRNNPERIAERTTARAVELLKQHRQEQLFMWIHYQDPHGPYAPPPSFAKMYQDSEKEPVYLKMNTSSSGQGAIPRYQRLGENRNFHYYVSQYDGEIRYTDEYLDRLFRALKELGKYENSLVIFTADHGEGMGEHDYYFAHGENLYNNLIHVPLIIKYGAELTGRRTDIVQHIDIVPTILKIVGVETDLPFRGRDLRVKDTANREIFAEMVSSTNKDESKSSMVLDDLKLIHTPLYNQYELFDLKTDRYEEHNLIDEPRYQKQTEDLKVRLKRISRENLLKLGKINNRRKLTDEEKEKLKSLGYVQ